MLACIFAFKSLDIGQNECNLKAIGRNMTGQWACLSPEKTKIGPLYILHIVMRKEQQEEWKLRELE